MDDGIVNRLGDYMKYKKLNPNSLSIVLGYAGSEKISRLFRKEDAKPSYDIIYDISNKFEDINIEWLISGKGEMTKQIRAPDTQPVSENEIIKVQRELIESLKAQVEHLTKANEGLAKDKESLNNEMDSLKAINTTLSLQIEQMQQQLMMLQRKMAS